MSSAPRSEEDDIATVEPDDTMQDTTPDQTTGDEVTEEQATAEVMALLSEHVPLALLADLAQPEGPASPAILEDEGLPDDPWWEQ